MLFYTLVNVPVNPVCASVNVQLAPTLITHVDGTDLNMLERVVSLAVFQTVTLSRFNGLKFNVLSLPMVANRQLLDNLSLHI